MTTAALLTAVLTYGPSIIPVVQKLVADIEAGKGNNTVTSEDLAELHRLTSLTAEQIFAGVGVTPPPTSK
jgi:hypothetical protein